MQQREAAQPMDAVEGADLIGEEVVVFERDLALGRRRLGEHFEIDVGQIDRLERPVDLARRQRRIVVGSAAGIFVVVKGIGLAGQREADRLLHPVAAALHDPIRVLAEKRLAHRLGAPRQPMQHRQSLAHQFRGDETAAVEIERAPGRQRLLGRRVLIEIGEMLLRQIPEMETEILVQFVGQRFGEKGRAATHFAGDEQRFAPIATRRRDGFGGKEGVGTHVLTSPTRSARASANIQR